MREDSDVEPMELGTPVANSSGGVMERPRIGKEKNLKRRTLVLTDLLSDHNDVSLSSIEHEVAVLEREIANAVINVATTVELKYGQFIPQVCNSYELLERIRKANNCAENAISNASSTIARINKECGDENEKDMLSRLEVVEECRRKLAVLEEIEQLMCSLWHSTSTDSPLKNASYIAAVEQKLKFINESDADSGEMFAERIYPNLMQALVVEREGLCHSLSESWNETFCFAESNEYTYFTISSDGKTQIAERISAMAELRMLDEKLAKLSNSIMEKFLKAIIMSSLPEDVFIYNGHIGVASFCKYCIRHLPTLEDAKKKNAPVIFEKLKEFFTYLNNDLGEIIVHGNDGDTPFVQMLCKKISGELVSIIVQEIINPVIPYDMEGMREFEELLELAGDFHNFMRELGLFNESTVTFKQFTENFDLTFINRRCAKIFMDARKLISLPYTEITKVGEGNVEEKETIKEVLDEAERVECGAVHFPRNYTPRILRLQSCSVSNSMLKFVELVKSTIKAAADSETDMAAERLLETARNLVQLFVLTAPRQHHAQICAVPQVAAVFYNNCYYLCHALMTMEFEIPPPASNALQHKKLAISFVEYFPKLRELAADVLEKQLAECRRQISTLLSDDQMFVGIDNENQMKKCEGAIRGSVMQLEQVARVWREVMSNMVYAKSMGNLAGFTLNNLIRIVISLEDIRACDAEIAAGILSRTISNIEQLFIIGNNPHTTIQRFAERPYYRAKEVVFCLNASLQDIFDRWCDGKGPLADCLKAKEVRQLVKALFQNTEKRARVLAVIC